ncbi:phosphate signaling complex protein PhoU [Salinimicrobium sp. HB62]|uniref:phosphate signaling complex protein PhoU n=1 Tax=Salinimicrobium sp. HB62 TaxID=3077781 RepID=UPI002D789E4D|nr:phosphate signaling complex protein PhoU [Salinimicrobium sp. HB62]
MITLDQHKEALNQAGLEMLNLCTTQLEHAQEAFFKHDSDLAEEVLHTENRVNALDLKIDRDCERFIALHNPVASDLRFVLALRKINFDLERVGDHAYGISNYIVKLDTQIEERLMEKMRVEEMFTTALSMLDDITEAYNTVDTKIARKVFKKDKILNEINMKSFPIISEEVKANAEVIDQVMLLFSVIKKLERIGDLVTNIAEEIIFFREAEVLKHRKKKGGKKKDS